MRRALLAAAFAVQPLVSEDVLEPSVLNEVDHALSRAPAEAFAAACATNAPAADLAGILGTNALSATEAAVRLVSAQDACGRWFDGTNDVTAAAVRMLRSLR